jgi:penicillin amidase
MAMQEDVYLAPADALSTHLSRVARAAGATGPVVEALTGWDGHYRADSAGALAFELVAEPLVKALEERSPKKFVSPYWRPFSRLTRLVYAATEDDLRETLLAAIVSAAKPFARYGSWGELHRVRLQHPLGKLPWLGPRLPTIEFPSGGTNDTLMKSMHPFTQKRHATNFAANARFVADLSDRDATWAVLLGGQDGWPGSRTMFDQVGHWRRGDQIRLPLSPPGLEEACPNVTTVEPAP